MIDVCFTDNETLVIRQIRKLREPYDYNSGRFIPFHFNYGLLEGDPIDTQARMEAESMRFYYPTPEDEIEQIYHDTEKSYHRIMEWLDSALQSKKSIRIWVSNTAHDICNLYWLCHYAQKYDPAIWLVKCPEYEIDSQTNLPVLLECWQQVSSNDTYLHARDNAVALTKNDILFYAAQWERLVKENMSLRILIDNSVISTSEDFFDSILLKHIGTTPVFLRTVLLDVLDEGLGIGYNFILGRLDKLIHQGLVLGCQESTDDLGFKQLRKICEAT